MKKLLLGCILCLSFACLAGAQNRNTVFERIAFKVDANLAFGQGEISRPSMSSLGEGRLGAQFYAGLELPITDGLYFNPGLAFNMKGTKSSSLGLLNSQPMSESSVRAHANFIKAPLFIGYRHSWSRNTSFSIQVGCFFSYAISAGIDFTYAYSNNAADNNNTQSNSSNNNPYSNKYIVEKLNTTMPDGRFDIGLCSAIQFGYDRYYLQLSTDYGLLGLGKGLLMIGTQNDGTENSYITSVRLQTGQVFLGAGIRF